MEILIDNTDRLKETLEYNITEPVNCMHEWEDTWYKENGEDFYKAMMELSSGLEKIRVKCLFQEDSGRFKCSGMYLWDGSLGKLIDCYSEGCWFDKYSKKLFKKIGLTKKIQDWQKNYINKLFQEVCKKYPKLVNELIIEIERPEYIVPGEYGIIDGLKIKYKYLNNITYDCLKKKSIFGDSYKTSWD